MRIPAALLTVVLSASTASAQTLELSAFRAPLGIEIPIPRELDGDPATREWTQEHYTREGAFEIRSVAVRPSGLCIGPWFRPFEIAGAAMVNGWDLIWLGATIRAGDRDRYVVWGVTGYYEIGIAVHCQHEGGRQRPASN